MSRIVDTSKSLGRIHDTSKALPQIRSKTIGTALGARVTQRLRRGTASPLGFLALAQVIGEQLVSTGGRPGLKNTEPRQKIPPQKGDWQRLKQIVAELRLQGIHCTPSQLASVLLHKQLEHIEEEKLSSNPQQFAELWR